MIKLVAISFSVFKDKLVSREKKQTIRKIDIPRLEQMYRLGIQLYWKQRTKESEKLYDAKLRDVMFILFSSDGYPVYECIVDKKKILEDENPFPFSYNIRYITQNEQEEIAINDGFSSLDHMAQWFKTKYGEDLTREIWGIKSIFMIIKWDEVG